MSHLNTGPGPDQDGVPAVGPQALTEADEEGRAAVADSSGTEVRWVFPIHVVLAGDVTREARDDIAGTVWNALYRALS
ncbi:hypothetical protein ACFVHB_28595 [Kitasatospora sp. NPDC127111]|uniref:hypothetical protein n=1 Tax=Kitasatospora sp. NPDC127111 TaxID=3345363 RepID=UPI00362B53AA